MEQVLTVLTVLHITLWCWHSTLGDSRWITPVVAAALAIGCYTLFPWVIGQNWITLKRQLLTPAGLGNLAVLIVAEGWLGILFCFHRLHDLHGTPMKKIWRVCYGLPGVSPLLAWVYAEIMVFHHAPGLPFQRLALYMAVGAALTMVMVHGLIKKALPATELRVELLVFVRLATCILLLVMVAIATPVSFSRAAQTYPWPSLLILLAAAACISLAGYIVYLWKLNKMKYNGLAK